ncbi:MAG: cellulase family glycosylhydrolase [Pyrinomonadaceae bacterium]|nr:cellulase family glycosylhydrolase [Pyrinomonadaceae bacterium]
MNLRILLMGVLIASLFVTCAFGSDFVSVRDGEFSLNKKPYIFMGTNYWYGSLLGLEKDSKRGITRLRKELDFLKSKGVTNLRILGGAEGKALINNVYRVGPSLQPEQGKFNKNVLRGLDIVLDEMSKRDMKAVIFFSNNWEWSGGFQQYLIWNEMQSKEFLTKKPNWDEYRDNVSRFYGCDPCKKAYNKQVEVIMSRRNSVNGRAYVDDPTIMTWELANEPRPMRPAANKQYKKWVADVAKLIKTKDMRHLVAIGHEGSMGTESIEIFEEIHDDKNVDYLTIHIWPRNWSWYQRPKIEEGFDTVLKKTEEYIEEHISVAKRLNKPMVIEEFGFARDGEKFDAVSSTRYRDRYFAKVFSYLPGGEKYKGAVAGVNFWAFGGSARPVKNQLFWKVGDEYMGDPPMEEQGLYSVFDRDKSTWKMIKGFSKSIGKR